MTSIARYAAMVSAMSAVSTGPALAADHGCSPAPIDTDALVRAQWPELADRIQSMLAGRHDIDTCASVTITMSHAMISVAVTLPDGRSASRSVSRSEDVSPRSKRCFWCRSPRRARPSRSRSARPIRAPARHSRQAAPPPLQSQSHPGRVGGLAAGGARARRLASRGVFARHRCAHRRRSNQRSASARSRRSTCGDGWRVSRDRPIAIEDRRRLRRGGAGARSVGRRRFRFGETALNLTRGPRWRCWFRRHGHLMAEPGPPDSGRMPGADDLSKRLLCGARLNFRARSWSASSPASRANSGSGDPGPPIRRGRGLDFVDPRTRPRRHRGHTVSLRRAKSQPAERDVPQVSDPEIMRRLAGGEIGALGELYDRYHEPVRRFVARATSDAEDVDDLVHATFLSAAKSAAHYDGRPSCRPWLIGIAVQFLRRRRRAFSRLVALLSSLHGAKPTAVDPRPALQARSDVERALRRISENKRVTFLMAEAEGMSCAEIAAALRIPIGTVWTRLHAARRELRHALGEGGDP